MSNQEEMLKVFNDFKIATYTLTGPTLAYYIVILVGMLRSKDRKNLSELIIVCLLMILS